MSRSAVLHDVTPRDTPQSVENNPGFLIRRLQQVATSLFLGRLQDFGMTPLQYTILHIIHAAPGIDQITVAARAVLDTSTTKDVVARLEAKHLISRRRGEHDRRTRTLALTPAGSALLAQVEGGVRDAQRVLLSPLPKRERGVLLRSIKLLLEAHEGLGDGNRSPWRRQRRAKDRKSVV